MLKILFILFILIIVLPSVICWLMWYFTEKKKCKPQSKLTDAQMQELLSDEGLTTKEVEGAIPAQSAQKEKLNTSEKTEPHETQTIVLKRDIYY